MEHLAAVPVFQSTADRCTKTPQQSPALKRRRKQQQQDQDGAWMLRMIDQRNDQTLYESNASPYDVASKSFVIAKQKPIERQEWSIRIVHTANQPSVIELRSLFSPQSTQHLPVIGSFVWAIIETQASSASAAAAPAAPTMPLPCNDLSALDLIAVIRILRRLGYYGATVPLERTLVQALEKANVGGVPSDQSGSSRSSDNRSERDIQNDDSALLYLAQVAYCDGLPYVWRFLQAHNAYERLSEMGTRDADYVLEQWDEQGAPTRSSSHSFVERSQFFWVHEPSTSASADFAAKEGKWFDGRRWDKPSTRQKKTQCSAGALCAKDADACQLCKQTLAKALVWNLMYGAANDSQLLALKSQSAIEKFEQNYTATRKRSLTLKYDSANSRIIDSCTTAVDQRRFANSVTVTMDKGRPSEARFVTIKSEQTGVAVQWPVKSLYEWLCIMLWQHSSLVVDISDTSGTAARFYTTASSNAPPLMSSTNRSDWILVPLENDQVQTTAKSTIWFEQFANTIKTLGMRVVESIDVPDTCLFW